MLLFTQIAENPVRIFGDYITHIHISLNTHPGFSSANSSCPGTCHKYRVPHASPAHGLPWMDPNNRRQHRRGGVPR